jgi:hypothetical protein
MPNMKVTAIVETFAREIAEVLEESMAERIQTVLAGAFAAPQKRGLSRPPRKAVASGAPVAAAKKMPRQLARTPWFENWASSIADMTCVDFGATNKVKTTTPKVARARKLQGQYLGALRSLKATNRARVKRTAQEKGVAEAVKLALSLKKA